MMFDLVRLLASKSINIIGNEVSTMPALVKLPVSKSINIGNEVSMMSLMM